MTVNLEVGLGRTDITDHRSQITGMPSRLPHPTFRREIAWQIGGRRYNGAEEEEEDLSQSQFVELHITYSSRFTFSYIHFALPPLFPTRPKHDMSAYLHAYKFQNSSYSTQVSSSFQFVRF